MKTTELSYSRSSKINTGNYGQDAPFYHAKVVVEGDIDYASEYAKLEEQVDRQHNAKVEEIEASIRSNSNNMKHLRIRDIAGVKYPSVTSILSPDPLPTMVGNVPMECYCTRGTGIHEVVNHYIETENWIETVGNVSPLKWEDIDYKGFFDEYGSRIDFKDCQKEVLVTHKKLRYSGEIDLVCNVGGEKTIADIKTGSWKWSQLCAYWHALADDTIRQLAIFDLKNFELKILKVCDMEKYWLDFVYKRGVFFGRFGV